MSHPESSPRLHPDPLRGALAGVLALLALGGWAYLLLGPGLRASLPAQSAVWWVEQLLILARGVVCLGLVLRRRMFVRPALMLSGLLLLFGGLHWWQALALGRVSLPVTALLDAMLIWRLLAAPRTQPLEAPAS